MKAQYVVHGIVQGVGYRAYVRGIAVKLGVIGFVKNLDDGSVMVVAQGQKETMDRFEAKLDIFVRYGVQVMNIEKNYDEKTIPEIERPEKGFRIIK